jgi:site-specific recombinase XerD
MATQVLDLNQRGTPLERLVDDFLANCQARGLSPRTVDHAYGFALHSLFLPWCAEQDIQNVNQLDGRTLDRYNALLLQRTHRGRPLSRHSVHHYIRPVRQMLTWAERIGEDVLAKPQLPKRPKTARDILSREQIDLMERVVPSERDKIIIRIFGDCGLRLNELTMLAPSDVIRSSGRQTFLRVLGKGGRIRDVPIPPLLLRRLERLIDARSMDRSGDQIFLALRRSPTGQFDPLTPSGVAQIVKDSAARAHIPIRVHAHLLRHSWITEMLRQGMNPIQLSLIAGASLEVIMQHYTHLTKDDAYDSMIRALTARGR